MFRSIIDRMIVFNPDEPPPGGGTDNGKTETGKTQEDNQEGKDKGNGTPANTGTGLFTPEQQAEINRIIGKTRQEEREKAKRDAEAEKAKQQGDFKKLYEDTLDTANKVPQLEQQVTALSSRINAVIDGEIKDWPDAIKALDPGKENVEARTSWVEKARTAAQQLLTTTRKAPDQQHGAGSGNGNGNADMKNAASSYMRSRYKTPSKKE